MKSGVKYNEKKKMAQLSAGSDDACISDALIGKFAQEFYYQFINVSEGTLVMESGTVVDSEQSVCPDCGMRCLTKTLYDRYREKHLCCDRCGTVLAADARFCPHCGQSLYLKAFVG